MQQYATGYPRRFRFYLESPIFRHTIPGFAAILAGSASIFFVFQDRNKPVVRKSQRSRLLSISKPMEAIPIENIMLFLKYYNDRILFEFLQHLKIIAISIPISILVSVPIGIYISSRPRIAKIVIYIAGILMTIPSLALFGIMVVAFAPWGMGLGMVPAVTAITVYSLLPITRNTYTALNSVSEGVLEAAKGMGLSKRQTLWKIRIPLSIPVIMAGVRTSVVLGVSVATFATLVGARGNGRQGIPERKWTHLAGTADLSKKNVPTGAPFGARLFVSCYN